MKRFTQIDVATGRVTLTEEGQAKGMQKVIERLSMYEDIGSHVDFKIYKQETAKAAQFKKSVEAKINELNNKMNALAKKAVFAEAEAFHTKTLALVMEVERINAANAEVGIEQDEKQVWITACENCIKKLRTTDFEKFTGILSTVSAMFKAAEGGKKDDSEE